MLNIFTTVVGSHMWKMEHPSSDVDIYTCYADRIDNLLSGKNTPFTDFKQYTNFDVTSIEVGNLVNGLIKNNPNYIYAVMTPIKISTSRYHQTLQNIVKETISLDVYKPLNGLATHNMHKYIINNKDASQKRIKTVARNLIFGIHLFKTGELKFNPVDCDITIDTLECLKGELANLYMENPRNLSEHTDETPYRNWLLDLREDMIHSKFRMI